MYSVVPPSAHAQKRKALLFYLAVAGEQSARPDLAILASEEDLIAPASRDFAAGKKLILTTICFGFVFFMHLWL
jgi:hypothetical protein